MSCTHLAHATLHVRRGWSFHSPLPSSGSRAASPSFRSEWQARSPASTADALSNGQRSQDNFSHVEYRRQSDDSAAEGHPWRTDLDEATLQELLETSPRHSMEIRAASEAGSASSDSVQDAADAIKRLSMTVPLWAPIVEMPEMPKDQQHTRDAAGHCKICGPDLFYMCLPSKCLLRKRWYREAVTSKVFVSHTHQAQRPTPQEVCQS